MQVMLMLELDPALLAQLIAVCQARGQSLAASAPSLPEAASIRRLLTGYGLTPRQCDLVLLDLQGYTRVDIAIHCGIKPLSVKKYWTGIYAQLGIQDRQSIRAWVLAQYAATEGPLPFELPDNPGDYPPKCPCWGDCATTDSAAILETQPHQPVEH